MSEPRAALERYARSLGFERFGVTSADPLTDDGARLAAWLARHREASMHWMRRDPQARATPSHRLPGARSVIVLAANYNPGERDSPPTAEGRIARYAQGRDYHTVLGKRAESFVRYLDASLPGEKHRLFLDTGPILERALARRAGVGFVGKNTLVITRGLGSWVFLAAIVTTAALAPDAPDTRDCGQCRLCLDACPTGALDAPYQLDAARCISYLTIEHRGAVEPTLAAQTAGWLFGCDICQEVCPHNTRVPVSPIAELAPGEPARVTLAEVLAMRDEAEFRQRFAGTPLGRAGFEGMIRNACMAAAALGRQDLVPALEALIARDVSPAVSEQARAARALLASRSTSDAARGVDPAS